MKLLFGHVSPETAYVVDDYPYGFRLRCKIRYWVEYKPKHGQRFMFQTSNPKKGHIWNTPKPGIYCPILIMTKDETNGHISYTSLSPNSSSTWYQFYATGYYHQADMPAELKKDIDALVAFSRKINPETFARKDKCISCVAESWEELGPVGRDGRKAQLEAKYSMRFYDDDFDDAMLVVTYEQSRK